MSEIKLRWEVTKATEHDYWAYNNILRIYIRYNVQSQKMEWETCPTNGGSRAKNGKSDTMPEAISAAKKAASDLLLEDLEPSPAPVVLEWRMCKEGWDADYNDTMYARIIGSPLRGFTAEIQFNGNDVAKNNFFTNLESCEAEARAWCVEQIQKIITPTK